MVACSYMLFIVKQFYIWIQTCTVISYQKAFHICCIDLGANWNNRGMEADQLKGHGSSAILLLSLRLISLTLFIAVKLVRYSDIAWLWTDKWWFIVRCLVCVCLFHILKSFNTFVQKPLCAFVPFHFLNVLGRYAGCSASERFSLLFGVLFKLGCFW